MGWIVGALLQRRWIGVVGFALIVLGSLLPKPTGVIILAIGAIVMISSGAIAIVRERRQRRATSSESMRDTPSG